MWELVNRATADFSIAVSLAPSRFLFHSSPFMSPLLFFAPSVVVFSFQLSSFHPLALSLSSSLSLSVYPCLVTLTADGVHTSMGLEHAAVTVRPRFLFVNSATAQTSQTSASSLRSLLFHSVLQLRFPWWRFYNQGFIFSKSDTKFVDTISLQSLHCEKGLWFLSLIRKNFSWKFWWIPPFFIKLESLMIHAESGYRLTRQKQKHPLLFSRVCTACFGT